MKILVLGAAGMLGHKVTQVLVCAGFEVCAVARGEGAQRLKAFFDRSSSRPFMPKFDVGRMEQLVDTVRALKPTVVVNCVGMIKQRPEASSVPVSVPVNAILPHLLSEACKDVSARLIHVSTDCVFSGCKGLNRELNFRELADLDDSTFDKVLREGAFLHSETDYPDALDVYGRSKALGEIVGEGHVLTLRTSVIGPELNPRGSLLQWLLAQRGSVRGFIDHFWSGVTTLRFAEILRDGLVESDLSGLFHLASPSLHKARLLKLCEDRFGLDVRVDQVASGMPVNRSLDGSVLDLEIGLVHPIWPDAIEAASADFSDWPYP